MKTLLSSFFFIFFITTGFSQVVSLNDLIKINSMSFDEFHEYANSRKYKLFQLEDDEKVRGFSYAYGQNKSNRYAIKVLAKNHYKKSTKRSVLLQTLVSGDYYNISDQLASSDFTFLSNKVGKEGTKFEIYRRGKNEVSLSSSLGYNPNGEKVTFYQVVLTTD